MEVSAGSLKRTEKTGTPSATSSDMVPKSATIPPRA